MKQIIRKALTFLWVYYAYMVEYRAELFLWVLAGTLPIILMGIWIQAAQSGQFGLSPVDFARYFITVFLVRQFTVAWVIWDFEREVVEGKLSPRLLQPIDPVWHHLAGHISERFARLSFAFLLMGLFFILYPQAFWLPSFSQLLLFILAVILAFSLRFIIQYTFAMLAFWTERASALENFWLLFYLFLSGLIAPLEVFPEPVRQIVMFTPFPYLVDFPASILVGLPTNLWQGFFSMVGWILIFLGGNRLLWRAGLKRYSGMGA
ncbi:multidrug ABC transporter permease [Nostoc linckia z18]|jgi:ABC-2 type transport system permease protein|uniref:Multidrug ABC transporter permease n=2 Tax=Nostoc linckia TaxID=92942 RepID=A0A9Q6EM47_NOSLI|nr:ABC-2 family transporter protein [Nostoc linckia]PHK28384.1 multidrug ABC transporter permease [Nostoc linckia z15]PHK46472.1 multidrug ABC transporter permease [Nostoc linckia z16]PHJ66235.1 multidrug ABC transporter permease [Nostoc linckia z1]PHJ71603.1 multidrug ABC transporter permease [Nostoc linckia z3]PHJ77677.1 multidrug ABC transporter permease [Nostoc linckia z2]